MSQRRSTPSLLVALSSILLGGTLGAAGCADPAEADDGSGYVDADYPDLPDAAGSGGFRDAGECGGGGSGGSGGSGGGGSGGGGSGGGGSGGGGSGGGGSGGGGSGGGGSGGSGGSGGCTPAADAGTEMPACGEATFSFASATATTVYATGSFSAWAALPPAALALTKDGTGTFVATRYLGPGKHLYKFVVDGTTWIPDPTNAATEPDGFGGTNSVLDLCDELP